MVAAESPASPSVGDPGEVGGNLTYGEPWTPDQEAALVATLMDKFGWCDVDAYLDMTPKQVNRLCLHPRDSKTGAIKVPGAEKKKKPKLPNTFETELDAIRRLSHVAAKMFPKAALAEATRKLQEKYKKKDEEVPPNPYDRISSKVTIVPRKAR